MDIKPVLHHKTDEVMGKGYSLVNVYGIKIASGCNLLHICKENINTQLV